MKINPCVVVDGCSREAVRKKQEYLYSMECAYRETGKKKENIYTNKYASIYD